MTTETTVTTATSFTFRTDENDSPDIAVDRNAPYFSERFGSGYDEYEQSYYLARIEGSYYLVIEDSSNSYGPLGGPHAAAVWLVSDLPEDGSLPEGWPANETRLYARFIDYINTNPQLQAKHIHKFVCECGKAHF